MSLDRDYINATLDGVLARYTSLTTVTAHQSRSAGYSQISTENVLRGLAAHGYVPTRVYQSRGRHGRHMVRLAHVNSDQSAPEKLEIVLRNSHDGQTAFKVMAGIFRAVCANGLIVGQAMLPSIRLIHTGASAANAIDASLLLASRFNVLRDGIDRMKTTRMSSDAASAYAFSAAKLRFGTDVAVLNPQALLATRRPEDYAGTVWGLLNIVQEHLIRGPSARLYATYEDGTIRPLRNRAITAPDRTTYVNAALWDLAASHVA